MGKNNKRYEWIENKFFELFGKIGATIFLVGLISLLISSLIGLFFDVPVILTMIIFFGGIILSFVFLSLSKVFSTRKRYTEEFLDKVRKRHFDAKSLQELKELRTYIYGQALDEDHNIRLSYPAEINKIINMIDSQIEIIEKIKNMMEKEIKKFEKENPVIKEIVDKIIEIDNMSSFEFDYTYERRILMYNEVVNILKKHKTFIGRNKMLSKLNQIYLN